MTTFGITTISVVEAVEAIALFDRLLPHSALGVIEVGLAKCQDRDAPVFSGLVATLVGSEGDLPANVRIPALETLTSYFLHAPSKP